MEINLLTNVNRGMTLTNNDTFKIIFNILSSLNLYDDVAKNTTDKNGNPVIVTGSTLVNKTQNKGYSERTKIYCWNKSEEFIETLSSKYESVFNKVDIVNAISMFMTTVGMGSLKTRYQALKVWMETEIPTFDFSVLFQAENDALSEVYKPIRTLQKLVVPSITNGSVDNKKQNKNSDGNIISTLPFFIPPTPPLITFSDYKPQGNAMLLESINIGTFLTLRNVFITDISVKWNIQNLQKITNKNGTIQTIPLSAEVDIKCISKLGWCLETIDYLMLNYKDELDTFPKTIFEVVGEVFDSIALSVNNAIKPTPK